MCVYRFGWIGTFGVEEKGLSQIGGEMSNVYAANSNSNRLEEKLSPRSGSLLKILFEITAVNGNSKRDISFHFLSVHRLCRRAIYDVQTIHNITLFIPYARPCTLAITRGVNEQNKDASCRLQAGEMGLTC